MGGEFAGDMGSRPKAVGGVVPLVVLARHSVVRRLRSASATPPSAPPPAQSWTYGTFKFLFNGIYLSGVRKTLIQ